MTLDQQSFLLRVARNLVGRHGLTMFFTVEGDAFRVWTGSYWGFVVHVDLVIDGPFALIARSGAPACPSDVAHVLRTKLRSLR